MLWRSSELIKWVEAYAAERHTPGVSPPLVKIAELATQELGFPVVGEAIVVALQILELQRTRRDECEHCSVFGQEA